MAQKIVTEKISEKWGHGVIGYTIQFSCDDLHKLQMLAMASHVELMGTNTEMVKANTALVSFVERLCNCTIGCPTDNEEFDLFK